LDILAFLDFQSWIKPQSLFYKTAKVALGNKIPPDPDKLSLEVGTPWVDRVYDRKNGRGFLVI
jgi:hypothetical protein